MEKDNRVSVTVRLPKSVKEEAIKKAKRQGLSMGKYLEMLILDDNTPSKTITINGVEYTRK